MPDFWGREQTRRRWTDLLEIVRASRHFPTPNRGEISLPGLRFVRAGNLAVPGGGVRCGRVVPAVELPAGFDRGPLYVSSSHFNSPSNTEKRRVCSEL